MRRLNLLLLAFAILLVGCTFSYTTVLDERGVFISWPRVVATVTPTQTQAPITQTQVPITHTPTPIPTFDPTPTLEFDPEATPPACDDLDNFEVEVTQRLNLRRLPSTNAEIVEVLPAGRRLEVQACQIPDLPYPWWYVLTLPDHTPGFVWSDFTRYVAPVTQSFVFIRVIGAARNIRSGAGLSYEPVGTLSSALCAAVSPYWRQSDGWVWYEGMTGHVSVKQIAGPRFVRFYEDIGCLREIGINLP